LITVAGKSKEASSRWRTTHGDTGKLQISDGHFPVNNGSFNLLKPTGYLMQQQVSYSAIVRSAYNVLCVLHLTENKQPLLSYIALNDWLL
jgi:hypothetical protein